MRTVCITGANRGIGLELARQHLSAGDKVIGICRNPKHAGMLASLRSSSDEPVEIVRADMSDPDSIADASAVISALTDCVHVLYNCAGINGTVENDFSRSPTGTLGTIDPQEMGAIFSVNAVGPLMLVQGILDRLHSGSVIANITSSMGSMGLMNRGGWYGYRASKAALNMLSRTLSYDMREHGVIVVAMHPGWVKTDMGTAAAPEPLVESVQSLRSVVSRLDPEDSGKFYNWKGEILPW